MKSETVKVKEQNATNTKIKNKNMQILWSREKYQFILECQIPRQENTFQNVNVIGIAGPSSCNFNLTVPLEVK